MHGGVRDDLADARELVLESYVNAREGTVLGVLKLAVLLQGGKRGIALVSVFNWLLSSSCPSLL